MLRISIVIPVYDAVDTLEGTLLSALNTRQGGCECIVMDGGSSDGSVDVIRKYAHHLSYWKSQVDNGQYAAIQEGFERSTGDVMAWLNSDDQYFPWTLNVVSEIFSNFSEIRWLTGLRTLRQRGATRKTFPFHSYPKELVRCGLFDGENLSFIQQESVFWRRDLWEEVGGLNTSYALAADFDLWRRFAEKAELYAVETPLGGFHFREGLNRSHRFFEQYKDEVHRSIQTLDSSSRSEREEIALKLRVFNRWRWLHGVRGALRRTFGLNRLVGPVLMWSGATGEYRVHHARMLS